MITKRRRGTLIAGSGIVDRKPDCLYHVVDKSIVILLTEDRDPLFPSSGNQRLKYTVRFALPPSLFSPLSHSPQSALVVASTSHFVFPTPITIAFSLLHDLVSESEVLNLFHPQFIDPYIRCYPIDQTLTATLLEILILRSLQKIVITFASGLEIGQTFFSRTYTENFPSIGD